MDTRWESRIGSLVAAAGVVWSVKIATQGFTGLSSLVHPTGGPLETCALGIVLWLHAKWRTSVRPR